MEMCRTAHIYQKYKQRTRRCNKIFTKLFPYMYYHPLGLVTILKSIVYLFTCIMLKNNRRQYVWNLTCGTTIYAYELWSEPKTLKIGQLTQNIIRYIKVERISDLLAIILLLMHVFLQHSVDAAILYCRSVPSHCRSTCFFFSALVVCDRLPSGAFPFCFRYVLVSECRSFFVGRGGRFSDFFVTRARSWWFTADLLLRLCCY
jgi:hypothetical protein